MDERNANGLLGDYIGGVYGTLIAAITMVAVLLAWRTSRRIDYRSRTYEVFSRMLETHEEIVNSIQLGDVKGREAVAYMLSEFSFVYKLVARVAATTGWSLDQRIDIAYTYTYYGPQQLTHRTLNQYAPADLKSIGDGMMKKARTNSKRVKGRQFKGHQNRLSHYFRNLFAAYSFIEASKLSSAEKSALGKVLRSKLSNYEQALLALNILSHLGKKWKYDGLVKTHMPVKNIPEHFYSFDPAFKIADQFPEVSFEWQ